MEYAIRPAAAEDLPRLLELYRDYFRGLLDRGMNYELNEETLPRVLETRIRSRLILTAWPRTRPERCWASSSAPSSG